jgi:hypothetical protein
MRLLKGLCAAHKIVYCAHERGRVARHLKPWHDILVPCKDLGAANPVLVAERVLLIEVRVCEARNLAEVALAGK